MEPLMWLIVLAVFLVIEAITVGLTTIWFAGGALAAAIAAGIGMGIVPQLLLFFCVSLGAAVFYKTGSAEAYEKRHRENKCGRSSWKKGCRDPEDQ